MSIFAWRSVVFVAWDVKRIAQKRGKVATSVHQPQTGVINIGVVEGVSCVDLYTIVLVSKVMLCN